MKLRNGGVALVWAVCCSFSYSEIINGTTENAASNGLNWSMTGVLPPQSGLTVNGVAYRYSVIKQAQDEMYVNIRNKDATGDGYVFNQQDNWSNLPGNTITKVVPVNDVPINRWGDGSITTQGQGQVKDATVVYTYRYDTCFNPIEDPRCPGYAGAMAEFLKNNGLLNNNVEFYDPLNDKLIKDTLDSKTELSKEKEDIETEEEKAQRLKKEKSDKNKKYALQVSDSVVANALAVAQESLITAMNSVPKFDTYYSSIPGGAYADTKMYKPEKLPENRKALRVGLAQQLLHEKIIDQQYNRESSK
jgi:hypothetical protein